MFSMIVRIITNKEGIRRRISMTMEKGRANLDPVSSLMSNNDTQVVIG